MPVLRLFIISWSLLLPVLCGAQRMLRHSDVDTFFAQTDPCPVVVKNKAVVLRSFMEYKDEVLPFVVSVGMPGHQNYSVNTLSGALIRVWHGEFADARLMWKYKARGISIVVPLGDVINAGNERAFSNDGNWTDTLSGPFESTFLGYETDSLNVPTFRYLISGNTIEDKISGNALGLKRSIHIEGTGKWMHRAASSSKITRMDDMNYKTAEGMVIRFPTGTKPEIIQHHSSELLIVAVDKNLSYELTW